MGAHVRECRLVRRFSIVLRGGKSKALKCSRWGDQQWREVIHPENESDFHWMFNFLCRLYFSPQHWDAGDEFPARMRSLLRIVR